MMLGQLGIYMKRMKVDLYLIPCIKTDSKWIKDLNVRDKSIKLINKNYTCKSL